MKSKVSYKLSYIYFICSVLVCTMHIGGGINFTPRVPEGNWLNLWLWWLGIPAMGWFFFSAAYFLFRSYEEGQYAVLLKKKCKTIVIPYLVWNVLGYFWMFFVYHKLLLGDNTVITAESLLKMFIFWFTPPDRLISPANGGTWFLARLFSYILLTPVFYKLCRKKWSIVVAVALEVIIVYMQISYYSILYWIPTYMLGAWVSLNFRDRYEKILEGDFWTKVVPGGGIVSIAAYIMYTYLLKTGMLDINLGRFLAPIVIWLCGSCLPIERKPGWYVKNSNFYMYLVHGFFVNVTIPWCWWNLGNRIPLELVTIFVCIITFIAVYGSLWGLRKVLPKKALSVIMGGRVK